MLAILFLGFDCGVKKMQEHMKKRQETEDMHTQNSNQQQTNKERMV